MDFNEERAIALKNLENHYNQSIGISECKKAFKEYKKVLEIINKEAEIRYLYRELNFHTSREMTFTGDIVQKTVKTERKAEKIFKKYNSFEISLYWYFLKLAIYNIRCEYRQSLEYAKQASQYFSKHPRQTRVIPGAYLNEALKYCLYLKDYEQGETLAEQIPKIMPKYSLNRIQGFQYCILFYLHQFKPRKAFESYQKIKGELTSHSSIQNIDKEKWDLLIFYIGWMLLDFKRVGRIVLSNSENELSENFRKNFHTTRFTNLSKDKQGWNVAIRVLDALYFITTGQTENLMLKEESLRKYKERYLKESKRTERSFLIFEVLDEITKNGLNNTTIKKVEKKLPALKKQQSETNPKSEHFQEVLPFEELWEHLRAG